MSVLDLKLADYSDGASVPNKPFQVLRTYLEPWNSTSMDEAAAEIIDLLPDDDPRESAMYEFGGICCEIGEQIPYNHPSHYKFAALLHRLGKSTKLCPTSTEVIHKYLSDFSGRYADTCLFIFMCRASILFTPCFLVLAKLF